MFSPLDVTISRLLDRDALRPPIPGDSGAVPTSTSPIGLNPKCKPAITRADIGVDFFVDVAAGGTIWTWHEHADGKLSGWKATDPLPELPNDPARIDDIVPVVQGVNSPKVVLSSCRLFVHNGAQWEQKKTGDFTTPPPDPNNPPAVTLVALAPVWEDSGNSLDGLKPGSEMIGVSDDNLLYRVTTDGECTSLRLVFGPNDEEMVDAGKPPQTSTCSVGGIRPATLKSGNTFVVVTASADRTKLVMYQGIPGGPPLQIHRIDIPVENVGNALVPHEIVGQSVEISFVKGDPQFSVLCRTPAGASYVASWQPLAPGNTIKNILFKSTASNAGSLGGPPVTLEAHVVAPGARGDLFVAPFNALQRHELQMPVNNDEDGAVLPSSVNPYVPGDAFSIDDKTDAYLIVDPKTIATDPEILYPVDHPIGQVGNDPELRAYRLDPANAFSGTVIDTTHLQLADNTTARGTYLLIQDLNGLIVCKVDQLQGANATLIPALHLNPADTPDYWTPEQVRGRVAPIIRLDPLTSGTWPASILEQARLYFEAAADPALQEQAKAFEVDLTNHPTVMALKLPWIIPPTANSPYVIDATLGDWKHLLADTSSNPELSWEYSNGTAWESLVLEEEGTLNFKNTGAIRFLVPDHLAAVDWAGKTNHWIRARLIGGDYGREEVEVITEDMGSKKTKQIVKRSREGIRPPAVVKLHISYGFCEPIRPRLVLAEDSGTVRDQSDANRTPGAIVEAFVPLALTLGRLTKPAITPETGKPEEHCPPECDCQTLHPKKAESAKGVAKAPGGTRISGREVYVGLAATLSEAPVNVLLLVKETDHTRFAPMSIEALSADRFVPIVADDATRALGESGVLSMTFAVPPTRSELFGKKDLTWLRLIPKANPDGKWSPTLRGAYLNAVFASATETLTRELLGSSAGAPNLTVTLARPPALRHTLELRVREPLGDEERTELLKQDPKSVLSAAEGLPGDWVLWKQVIDPDDEPDTARVYALDETSGEIRFGDGQRGRIPPIGRDSIVAFAYARTEPDPTGGGSVPGNTIEPRTNLNLVSPVETVESVTVADQAAGGAPPESDDRVLRYGYARVRHRGRAVTAEDLEDLALQSSPDIVQARAFVRRGYIRLVVVMRGKDPVPTAAQIRELRRLLLDAAPVSLGAPNALRIEGPRIRRLRVELELLVETLDRAGEVSASVKQKLFEFFDTGSGGIDKDGWQLGDRPSEEDIAFAISDAPHLQAIGGVTLHEITEDGTELPALEGGSPREIVMLADDPIRIQFETAEVMA